MVGRACANNVSAWDRAINTDIIRKNHRREGRPALCPNAGVATSRGLLFLAGRIVGTLRRCVGWSYWSETLVKSVAGGLLRIGMRHDHDMTNRRLDAVILAGGCAHRLGGVAKANLRVGTRRLLDVVLDAVDGAREGLEGSNVVVARESVEVPWSVIRTMEDPPGSGPLAGIRAGLQALPPAQPDDLVLVCAVDSPGIGRSIRQLREALEDDPLNHFAGAVTFGGVPKPHRQLLQGLYRRVPLEASIAAADTVVNRSVHSVLGGLCLLDLPVEPEACRDLDTPGDVEWWLRHIGD